MGPETKPRLTLPPPKYPLPQPPTSPETKHAHKLMSHMEPNNPSSPTSPLPSPISPLGSPTRPVGPRRRSFSANSSLPIPPFPELQKKLKRDHLVICSLRNQVDTLKRDIQLHTRDYLASLWYTHVHLAGRVEALGLDVQNIGLSTWREFEDISPAYMRTKGSKKEHIVRPNNEKDAPRRSTEDITGPLRTVSKRPKELSLITYTSSSSQLFSPPTPKKISKPWSLKKKKHGRGTDTKMVELKAPSESIPVRQAGEDSPDIVSGEDGLRRFFGSSFAKFGSKSIYVERFLAALWHHPEILYKALTEYAGSSEKPRTEHIHDLVSAVMWSVYATSRNCWEENSILSLLEGIMVAEIKSSTSLIDWVKDGSTMFSRFFTVYARHYTEGYVFLRAALTDVVLRVLQDDTIHLEVNPTQVVNDLTNRERSLATFDDSGEYLQPESLMENEVIKRILTANYSVLAKLCNMLMDSLAAAADILPVGVRRICSRLYSIAKSVNPDEAAYLIMDFLYLRLVHPALVHPEPYGIIADTPVMQNARRNLLLISKASRMLLRYILLPPSSPYGISREPYMSAFLSYYRTSGSTSTSIASFVKSITSTNSFPLSNITPRSNGPHLIPSSAKSVHTLLGVVLSYTTSSDYPRELVPLFQKLRECCSCGSQGMDRKQSGTICTKKDDEECILIDISAKCDCGEAFETSLHTNVGAGNDGLESGAYMMRKALVVLDDLDRSSEWEHRMEEETQLRMQHSQITPEEYAIVRYIKQKTKIYAANNTPPSPLLSPLSSPSSPTSSSVNQIVTTAQLRDTLDSLLSLKEHYTANGFGVLRQILWREDPSDMSILIARVGSLLLELDTMRSKIQQVTEIRKAYASYAKLMAVRSFMDRRRKEVDKFVELFEVLTNPIPPVLSASSLSSSTPPPQPTHQDLPNAKSLLVTQFIDHALGELSTDPRWRGATEREREEASSVMEKFFLAKVYPYIFRIDDPEGQVNDGDESDHRFWYRVQQITGKKGFGMDHEEIRIPKYCRKGAEWEGAQKELMKINVYKAPSDKLSCIVRCCRAIMNLISPTHPPLSPASPIGADEFLPVLVYVVLKANPPNLLTNISYIRTFYDHRLSSAGAGEASYWWSQFLVAVEYIKTLKIDMF